jgi:hypothetical protein
VFTSLLLNYAFFLISLPFVTGIFGVKTPLLFMFSGIPTESTHGSSGLKGLMIRIGPYWSPPATARPAAITGAEPGGMLPGWRTQPGADTVFKKGKGNGQETPERATRSGVSCLFRGGFLINEDL